MRGKVSRWGNSLAIRIPKAVANEAGIGEDRPIEIRVEHSTIVVEPLAADEEPTLEELVAGITPENRHGETDWGPPAGREVW
jgi:antitoxin MazE